MKKNKKIKILISIPIFFFIVYFFSYSVIGEKKFTNLKSLLTFEQKQFIKKYFFPYKFIAEQNQTIMNQSLYKMELEFKRNSDDIKILKDNLLTNGYFLKRLKLYGGFYAGIANSPPGTGYLDFNDDVLFVLSSRGVLAYSKNIDKENNLKQIKNNINEFIDLKQFIKNKWFSIKDIFVSDKQIFVSYTEEIEENCWNTSVIYGDINYEKINFTKLFSPKTCVHSYKNIDNEFNATQSGGRIIQLNKNNILLSIGDYRSRHLAQDRQSVNGKIIKINIIDGKYEIVSMGHRNPQGLYFDKKKYFILETEHGPRNGDEINLIEINEISNNEPLNYGWPIASYGEHYCKKRGDCPKNLYTKYPLYKSHSKYNFIEPLKSFVPAIGISEIVKIADNKYVLSSLKDKSIYFFELSDKKKIINLEKIEISERIRDLKFNNNKLYLFLENTASIGIIDLNKD